MAGSAISIYSGTDYQNKLNTARTTRSRQRNGCHNTMISYNMRALLINSIKLLASTPNEQREYLKKHGLFPSTDEIALEFDDAYQHVAGQTDQLLPTSISNKLKRINSILNVLSNPGDNNNWDEQSLDNSEWTAIREIANKILSEIE